MLKLELTFIRLTSRSVKPVYMVVHAHQLDSPVMASMTTGGPFGVSANIIVGQGAPVAGSLTEDRVLSIQVLCCDVVDPDQLGTGEDQDITIPDISRFTVA